MKNKKKYIILAIISLIIVVSMFYILVINNNVFKEQTKEEPKYWYSNNLFNSSIFAMREIGTKCTNRYLYFYKNKLIIADWEDNDKDPIILDIIYYKNNNINYLELLDYAKRKSVTRANDNSNTNKTYYNGIYQIIEKGSTIFIEKDDTKVLDFLNNISTDNLFDCHNLTK